VNASPAVMSAMGPLRDLPHVQGCFVVSEMGRLLARDLSALFGDDILAEVAPRALRLCETFSHNGEEMRGCTLRFKDHLVLLRPMRDGILCVLASAEVNPLALRMGLNLTVRRLNAALDPTTPPHGTQTPI
jgi:predicted regulator of Ras-like GTPase activity (Roadblock/LC7/MglB family)